uniref:Uncharacterized protein n=1 Tax=Solanum lycopersicum TaxID=4081 RepID=A0A3Q7J0A3_SOLLC
MHVMIKTNGSPTDMWLFKSEYDKCGTLIVRRKCFYVNFQVCCYRQVFGMQLSKKGDYNQCTADTISCF